MQPPAIDLSPVRTTWRWVREPYRLLDELSARYGDTFSMRIAGLGNIVMFSNPESVRAIFSDDGETLAAGKLNKVLAPFLGDRSVLMADGRSHLRKRKLLLPPFHGERMQAYGETMRRLADMAIDTLPMGTPTKLHGHMQSFALDVIIRTIFGIGETDVHAMTANTKRVLELGAWTPLLFSPMQVDLGPWSPWGRFRRAVAETDAVLYREIERRRKSSERGPDILSLLLDARDEDGQPMSKEELRDELVTLLVAGHETTATALTWAVAWLLETPGAWEDLRREVLAIGSDASPERIAKCELLDSVAREALRLVPVIPIVGRELQEDMTIAGYPLRRGQVVVCSIYLAHRRAGAFPRPNEFDPRRFVGKKPSAHEFFPFGGGVRRCVGMAFALYEMKIMLARMVARTELVLAEPGPVRPTRRSITITPEGGLPIVVRTRRTRGAPATA